MLSRYLPVLLLVFCNQVFAGWTLNVDESDIHFVSIKKGSIAEVHTFDDISGSVSDQGEFQLVVNLSSVNTQIDIRNERMKEHLFEVQKFPLAKITGNVNAKRVNSLKVGQKMSEKVSFSLALHGQTITSSMLLSLTKMQDGIVRVRSIEPFIVNASQFDLSGGIEKLRELASLPSIATAIPVTFSLEFVSASSKK